MTFALYVEGDEINLACPASPIHYQLDPVTTKTSVHGAIDMPRLAKRVHARIFQASASEVYGDAHVHAQQEACWGSVNPIGPHSCYDDGKRCAETLFMNYRRRHELAVKIAHLKHVWAAHASVGWAGDFEVHDAGAIGRAGHGLWRRHPAGFVLLFLRYVDAFFRLMSTPYELTGPVNLGNPPELPMLDIARRNIELTGSSSEIVVKPLPMDVHGIVSRINPSRTRRSAGRQRHRSTMNCGAQHRIVAGGRGHASAQCSVPSGSGVCARPSIEICHGPRQSAYAQ